MAVFHTSGEPQIHIEIGEYQRFPRTQDQQHAAQRSRRPEKLLLSVVVLTLGLLCLIQALLNIFLRLFLSCSGSSSIDMIGSGPDGLKPGGDTCQQGWTSFGSSCYYISSETRGWNGSREDCMRRGADLAIIESIEELVFLERKIKAAWIGMTDLNKEQNWKWVDGTQVTTDPDFWAKGQPDNAFGGEDCGELRGKGRFSGLNDYNCKTKSQWICEERTAEH